MNFKSYALITGSILCIALSSRGESWTASHSTGKGIVSFLAVARPGGIKIEGKPKDDKVFQWALGLSGKEMKGVGVFATNGFKTGMSLRDRHLQEYLESEKYPSSKLTLYPISLPAPFQGQNMKLDNAPFTGKLNLHGKDFKVQGTVSSQIQDGQGKLRFQFPVVLSDFAIKQPSYMGIKVDEKIQVSVEIETPFSQEATASPKPATSKTN